jgi:hypothetical protein
VFLKKNLSSAALKPKKAAAPITATRSTLETQRTMVSRRLRRVVAVRIRTSSR